MSRTNFRAPKLPYGNIDPNWTHSSSERPHSDVTPAAWLPISGHEDNVGMGFFSYDPGLQNSDIMVIMAGKLVGITREQLSVTNFGNDNERGPVGRVVPAGVRVAWAAADEGDTVLRYTTADVDLRIEDLATGLPVTATAVATPYTKTALTAALKSRGLLRSSETLGDFISPPVGVLAVNAYVWAGGDGLHPSGYRQHNYKRQHKVNLLCDWVLRLAQVPTAAGNVDVPAIGTVATVVGDFESGTGTWIVGNDPTLITPRYGTLTNKNWVALALGRQRVEHSLQAPIVIKNDSDVDVTDTFFVSRKRNVEDLATKGDYLIDSELGLIFFYEAGGDDLPTPYSGLIMSTSFDVEFSYHADHTNQYSAYPAVVGDVRPGDYLVCDLQSNFRPYRPAPALDLDLVPVDIFVTTVAIPDTTDDGAVTTAMTVWTSGADAASSTTVAFDGTAYDRPEDIVAQVLTMSRFPKEDMEMVKTFWENSPVGLRDRTPGSATRGYSDTLTYTRGGQFEVIINLLK